MNRFFLSTLLILSCFLNPITVEANHQMGGELSYKLIDSSQFVYEINFTSYRQCYHGVPPFDDPIYIGVYDTKGCGNLVNGPNGFDIPFTGLDTIPNQSGMPCLIADTNVCVDYSQYSRQALLPPIQGGYKLLLMSCCRISALQNIGFPTTTGISYFISIPDTAVAKYNSAPSFNYPAPVVICQNENWSYDNSATDPDGDSLVYCLMWPYNKGDGILGTGSLGNPACWPTMQNVNYNNGYSFTDPFGQSDTVWIDSHSGELHAQISVSGFFAMGIMVKEYRNGVLLSEMFRDYTYQVAECDSGFVSKMEIDTPDCSKDTVFYRNIDPLKIYTSFWDFGDAHADSGHDVKHVYSNPGNYIVRMVNYHPDCSDTLAASIGVNVCSSVEENESKSIVVSPNPADRVLKISNLRGVQHKLRMFDLKGSLVLELEHFGEEFQVQIDHLEPGVYLLQVDDEMSEKIVIY